MVALFQSLLSQTVPALFAVQSFGCVESDLEVAALNGEVESSRLVLHKVQSNLGVAFLGEVGDDALTNEVGRFDDVQDFLIVAAQQSKLEAILCGVDGEDSGFGVAIQAVHVATFNTSEVDGLLESLDDAVVALGESILDVVEGRIDKDATVIPSA